MYQELKLKEVTCQSKAETQLVVVELEKRRMRLPFKVIKNSQSLPGKHRAAKLVLAYYGNDEEEVTDTGSDHNQI